MTHDESYIFSFNHDYSGFNELLIEKPELVHSGVYECFDGISTAQIEIEIIELPEIILRCNLILIG